MEAKSNLTQNDVMTINEVADYLRCHTSTIYRLLKMGKLRGFKLGSDWRFNRETIVKWRLEQETTTNNK